MKKKKLSLIIGCILCLASTSLMFGCAHRSGGTYDEPEITADYLTGEYAEQLTTDGAKTFVGSVVLKRDGDSYDAIVEEKKIVASDDYDEGYYIADTNSSHELEFDEDIRIVVSQGEDLVVSNPEDFIKDYNNSPDMLYNVYYMGDYLELLVPLNPAEQLNN